MLCAAAVRRKRGLQEIDRKLRRTGDVAILAHRILRQTAFGEENMPLPYLFLERASWAMFFWITYILFFVMAMWVHRRERGLTMVLVTHETTVAQRAKRIAVMNKGRLAVHATGAAAASVGLTPND